MRSLAAAPCVSSLTAATVAASAAPRRAAAPPRCQALPTHGPSSPPPPRRAAALGSSRGGGEGTRVALSARSRVAAAGLSGEELDALFDDAVPGARRSAFRSLLAASAQAIADVEAYETWTGRLAMTLFFIELSFEEISGGSSLFARVDLSTAESCLSACAAACVLGAVSAFALLPLAKQHLASASRGALSRALTSSILLVSDDDRPGTMRSVAEDLYSRALDSALDDALRVLRPAVSAAAEVEASAVTRMAPTLARAPASNALLRTVLAEEDSTA